MKYKTFITGVLILFLVGITESKQETLAPFLKDKIINFYTEKLGVSSKDIKMEVYHAPVLNKNTVQNHQISIEPRNHEINPGYQTLKIRTWKNQQLQNTYSLTMKVSVKVPVLIASQKIAYKESVTSENTELKAILVDSELDKYFRKSRPQSEMVSKQLIRKGEIITSSMVKKKPDANRGELVNVHLLSGGILIKTKGRLSRDCAIGEAVQVTLKSTRKKMRGQLQSSDLIVVNLQ
jgi:flagella basal body P-ring formation protein FlgA